MREAWPSLLLSAAERDFATRARLARSGELFDGYHPEMEVVHSENAALLERAIEDLGGWPTRSKFGDDIAGAAFLIVQHAISRPDFQRRALALLLDAAEAGEINVLDTAYLADRIAVFEGCSQTFGTQFDWDDQGLLSPAPIASPATIDDLRASVGLGPISEAIAEMRARAAADDETAPSNLATRRAQFEAWAKSVGWRA